METALIVERVLQWYQEPAEFHTLVEYPKP